MSSGRVAWVKGHIQWHLAAHRGVAATQHLYLRILSWQRLLVVIQVPEKGCNRGFPSDFIEVGWHGEDVIGLGGTNSLRARFFGKIGPKLRVTAKSR
jgi:hypothetical protein